MKTKKIISILVAVATLFIYGVPEAYAAVPAMPATNKVILTVGPNERPSTYPYQKLYTITAYYRPMPGQKHYATGSYYSEIALDGQDHGADGTAVYPGMIAAPKSYDFGIKMYIPGVGIGTIHDRGGAIVEAGKKNQTYDRLDIWVGSGDKGLDRALAWGRRTKMVTVFGPNDNIKDDVYLDDYTDDENNIPSRTGIASVPKRVYTMFKNDIWYLSKGDDVTKLQNVLYQLGYLDSKPTGFYGSDTRTAVFNFQQDNDIVDSFDENGAGHTGPQTRWKLEVVFNSFNKEKFPRVGLKKGSKDSDVKSLQKILKELGYSVEETGVFDEKTENALITFQIDYGILPDTNAPGVGFVGPKTRVALIRKYLAKINSNAQEFDDNDALMKRDLQFGDKGKEVAALQKELVKMSYLKINPTGYFGVLTKHAVFKFQQALGLMGDEKTPRAGIFGPVTRDRMNGVIAQRMYTKQMIAAKKNEVALNSFETSPR